MTVMTNVRFEKVTHNIRSSVINISSSSPVGLCNILPVMYVSVREVNVLHIRIWSIASLWIFSDLNIIDNVA